MGFEAIQGSWRGTGELWLDPLGNEVSECTVTATCEGGRFAYSWSHEGTEHQGQFGVEGDGLAWIDTFHQSEGAHCARIDGAWGVIQVRHEYSAPGWGTWGWRTGFVQRPDGTLVVQMTNIAPWGEEGRAVRFTLAREE